MTYIIGHNTETFDLLQEEFEKGESLFRSNLINTVNHQLSWWSRLCYAGNGEHISYRPLH
jgi:hypothetical protein